MQALLRVIQKQANVQQVRLLAETVIGRSVDCNLKIASTQVSRRHCRVKVNDLGVYVEDLCSANGTFLDGKRLLPNQPTFAPAGSQLVIGPATFSVEYRVSMVSLPELGASTPTVDVSVEVAAPVETTSIPLADMQAAIASSNGVPAEQSLAAFASLAADTPLDTVTADEPPRRMRSLFGLFQRGEKKAKTRSASVPFLPTEPQVEPNPVEDPAVIEAVVADETMTANGEALKDSAEAAEVDNPFRQFSQY